jgi:hypothetical protein
VLAPGANVPFSFSVAAHGGSTDDFRIIALGLAADE